MAMSNQALQKRITKLRGDYREVGNTVAQADRRGDILKEDVNGLFVDSTPDQHSQVIEAMLAAFSAEAATWLEKTPRPAGKTNTAEYKAWRKLFMRDHHNPLRSVSGELERLREAGAVQFAQTRVKMSFSGVATAEAPTIRGSQSAKTLDEALTALLTKYCESKTKAHKVKVDKLVAAYFAAK